VGHALRHDLAALLLVHPEWHVRDTARYPGFRALSAGRTPALRELVERVLGVRIQSGMHSSVEDARAAMALFRGEKEGFEREVFKRFRRPREERGMGDGEEGEEGDGEAKKKKRKGKKKKRKGKK